MGRGVTKVRAFAVEVAFTFHGAAIAAAVTRAVACGTVAEFAVAATFAEHYDCWHTSPHADDR